MDRSPREETETQEETHMKWRSEVIELQAKGCWAAAAAAKSLQSCPTLCDPIDGNLPGSAVPGILQARTLEWVAIAFSNAWKWKVKVKSLSWCPTLRGLMDWSNQQKLEEAGSLSLHGSKQGTVLLSLY